MSTAIELERETKDGGLAGSGSRDVEQNETAPQERSRVGQLSAEELVIEKKLLRKIDMRIMPVVITIYLMNYIDRYFYLSSLCLRSKH